MAKLTAEGTRTLARLIEAGVLVPVKKERIVELFTVNSEARCTCTSCGDGDRIGRILDRFYQVSESRKVHLFTENGGPLAHCDDSPLLVAENWSNESVRRMFSQIEVAQQKLGKGRMHGTITHFPCGAAASVGFSEVEQLQMFMRAIRFKHSNLDVPKDHLVKLVHIEWCSQESASVLISEFPHLFRDKILRDFEECLLAFKISPWEAYCKEQGIEPELDVHAYNLKRFGRPVSNPSHVRSNEGRKLVA